MESSHSRPPGGMRPVRPISPPAPYMGGKRNLAKRLVEMIDGVDHVTYAEVFVGMGGVFLRRTLRPQAEVINDISRDVSNLFRILQRHYPQFLETLKFQITSRAEFERLCNVDPDTLTDFERAARFVYLQRTAFGGKIVGRNFGISIGNPGSVNMNRLGPIFEALHDRLAEVIIERLDWAEFVARYDSPQTLFYLDPPYAGCEEDYGKGIFAPADFARIAERLGGIKGQFILSVNDRPAMRECFAGFNIASVKTTYTLPEAGAGHIEAGELIVSNLDPSRSRQGRLV